MNPRLRFRACLFLIMIAFTATSNLVAALDPIDDRVAQLQRDEDLIKTLVEGGLQLSAEEDPLTRAMQCNSMVDKLADEINGAMKANDAARATQLGDHMHQLMVKGVAANLGLARATMEANSPRAPEIARIADKATLSAKKMEDEIIRQKFIEPSKMKGTVQSLAKGRTEIEKALTAKTKSKAKNDKGKKGKF
jgi:hypothetical protein